MSSSHDAAIAYLIAQSVTESAQSFRESEPKVVAVTMNPTSKKSKPAKNEAAPIPRKSNVPGIAMPERGSLDAKGFLLAMRNAGKRVDEAGKPYVNANEVRNDQIQAIHAFYYEVRQGVEVCVGYDPNRDFGSQEQAARMLAQRVLRGYKVVEVAKPSLSAGGYVAGMPDHKARRLANLEGQEVVSADAMIQHEKDAANVGRSAKEREMSQMLADIERDRLASIRRQIAELL